MTTGRRRGINSPDPERKGGGNRGKFIPYIQLRDDMDRVRFRPLSEVSEDIAEAKGTPSTVLVGEFHRVECKSTRGKTFFKDIICGLDIEDDDGTATCVHCDDGVDKRTRFMCWAYVYAYYHQHQNPKYNPRDPKTDDQKWEMVKLGQSKAYKEEIEDYQVWMDGFYMREALKDVANINGCLTDRDFLVTRQGARNTTTVQRHLKELKEEALKPEYIEGLKNLPELDKIATGEIETLDGVSTTAPIEHEEVPLDDLPDEFGSDGPVEDLGDDLFSETPVEDSGDSITTGNDDLDDLPF